MSTPEPEPPLDVYRRRLAARRATAERLSRIDAGIAVVAAGGVRRVAGARLAGLEDGSPRGAVALPCRWRRSLVLVIVHDRVIRARERAERAARLYEDGIARIEDRPPPGDGRSGAFRRREPPLRERPRSVRQRLAVRAAVDRAHLDGGRDVRGLAEGAGGAGGGPGAPAGGRGARDPGSISRRTWR